MLSSGPDFETDILQNDIINLDRYCLDTELNIEYTLFYIEIQTKIKAW